MKGPAIRVEAASVVRARLLITGVVQGVGFRPFIHRQANRFGLYGWVLNSTEGVVIDVEGAPESVEGFVDSIVPEAPPRAVVDRVERTSLPPIGYTSFAIEPSDEVEGHFALISPDICICEDCLREMQDPSDRRYRYPFVNCTNCGPRFTVVKDIPYDRPKTTMGCFPMCPECEAEYHDPNDRRFHAQPNACPVCGPKVWLTRSEQHFGARVPEAEEAIEEAQRLLVGGAVLAVKGMGGFHLVCDATNDDAVSKLRHRKRRSDKPFAIMSLDSDTVATYCYLSEVERQLLESPQRPIVLLRRKEHSPISPLVAPNNRFLGVMLPYTPLHYLLFEQGSGDRGQGTGDGGPGIDPRPPSPDPRYLALVMTSGNLSEEPIATGNREALERLHSLADAFLFHNRDIQTRCDDSVTRIFMGKEAILRRSRGYAPFPVRLDFEMRDLLACGAHLKNTFCISKGNYAFLSQHIGDLENLETLKSFEASVDHYSRLFRLKIAAVAHDLHPEYLSTRYAWEKAGRDGLPLVPVQHHHAHVAACMAENGSKGPVIGVAFDGTGYGDDGLIWGGEFLVCDLAGYRRAAHLRYLPLPGGEAAVRRPCRMAASYLLDAFGPAILDEDLPPVRALGTAELDVLQKQIRGGINSPLTSSAGRLFDAVSSLVGIRHEVNYEGQAAIELETAADLGTDGYYDWTVLPGSPLILDSAPLIRQVVEDVRREVSAGVIAAKFHNTVARMVAAVCGVLRDETGIGVVALSGGVFQNLVLLGRTNRLLKERGFEVLTHHQVPPNDGGVSLGQAVIANGVLSSGF